VVRAYGTGLMVGYNDDSLFTVKSGAMHP